MAEPAGLLQQQPPTNKAKPYVWDTALLPPTKVLQLWTEVANGLDKDQAVVWKDAVRSLEYANQHLTTSEDARHFVEAYAGIILEILVLQTPKKIGKHERACVEESMTLGIMIVVKDLRIQIARRGECKLVDGMLSHILSKKMKYSSKLPKVRLRNVGTFRSEDGFALLRAYMKERIEDPGNVEGVFPSSESLRHILLALFDTISASAKSENFYAESNRKTYENHAIEVSKTIMQHLSTQSDNAFKTIRTDYLNDTIESLQCLYDVLVYTRREATVDFYAFWRSLALSMITSPSLPLKLLGWEHVKKLVYAALERRPPPRSLVVSGAGCTFVNGEYRLESGGVTADGYAKLRKEYVRRVPETEPNGAGKKLTIFLCTLRNQQKSWFLSEADEVQPGTDLDVDYYFQKARVYEEECLAPSNGWITCSRAGIRPPPVLQSVGILVSPGQELETLEHHLRKWAIENKIVERVLGDVMIHRGVVARSTELVKFLVSMYTRDEKDKTTMATLNKLLLRAWEVCQQQDMSNREIAKEIAKLFATVLPIVPTKISLPLIGAIRNKYETWQANDSETRHLWNVADIAASTALYVNPSSEEVTRLPDCLGEEVRALVHSVSHCPEIQSYASVYAILFPFDTSPVVDSDDKNEETRNAGATNDIRYAGMVNSGSSDYVIVILQQLFMAPSVRKVILSLSDHDVSNSQFLEKFRSIFRHLAHAMQLPKPTEAQAIQQVPEDAIRVGLPVIRSFLDICDPTSFVEKCGKVLNLTNDIRGHNDASEFCQQLLRITLDQVTTVPQAAESLEKAVFVTSSTSKTCQLCDSTTNGQQLRIPLIDCRVKDAIDLVAALDKQTNDELMKGSNKVHCDSCGNKADTVLKTGFGFPDVAIFHLKRFELDFQSNKTYKTDSCFTFDELLRLHPYCLENAPQKRSLNYRLVGVVVHTGNADKGSYKTLIHDRAWPKQWLQFADEDVTVFDRNKFSEVCFGGKVSEVDAKRGQSSTNATMLVYERILSNKYR